MTEAGEEVTAAIKVSPPADGMVGPHGLHVLVGGMIPDGNVAFLIQSQENLDPWQAGDRFVEVQPVGSVGEFLALACYDRVSLGLGVHQEAGFYKLGISVKVAACYFDQFRPGAILNDASMHDHDAASLAEPRYNCLALLYGQAFTEVRRVIEKNEVVLFQIANTEFIGAFRDADVDIVFCTKDCKVAIDPRDLGMTVPGGLRIDDHLDGFGFSQSGNKTDEEEQEDEGAWGKGIHQEW